MTAVHNSPPGSFSSGERHPDGTTHSTSGSTSSSQDANQRVKQLTADAKRRTKSILHIDNTKEQIGHNDHAASREIDGNAAFNPSQTLEVEAGTLKQIKNKLPKPHNLKELGHIIRHPKVAFEDQVSKTLDASDDPHLSRQDDENLIGAHEKLKELEASDPLEFGIEERIANLHKSIDNMDDDRQRKKVAWISSRYVTGCRVVQEEQHGFPFLSSCRWVDESGRLQGARWSQWIVQYQKFAQHLWTEKPALSPNQAASERNKDEESPNFDQDDLLQEVHRVIISSSPIQRWISDLHKLRNWQNPQVTALWLAVWLAVWTYNRFFVFVYLYSVYKVLQTSSAFKKRESLREAYNQAHADDEMSNTLSEMITRHGSTKWLQPTIDIVGPNIQPKLRSAADWLEIFVNFPEAKTGRSTISFLSALGGAILVANFASTAFCVRTLELILILLFFIDKPLSGRYPKYRSVIVPLHWILWDVPTDTETAFRYLRQRAREIQNYGFQRAPNSASSMPPPLKAHSANTPSSADVDLLATKCEWDKTAGSVVLTSEDIRFMRNVPGHEMWRRRFEDIEEMRKVDGRTSLLKQVEHILEFRFKDGRIESLEHLRKSDEIFNIIFAFSGMQWQQL